MATGRATSAVSAAGSSCRSRAIDATRRRSASRWRSFGRSEPNGAPPLVLLHGGPGAAGDPALLRRRRDEAVPRHRDVVIYDQRGAGFSEPKLCPGYESVAESAYNLRDGAEKDTRLREARRACIAELDAKGIDRLAYNTAASAADLIDLRRTLGYVSWDIRGGSYGARLAQEAMVRDGQAIRSVVLASPVARGFPYRLNNHSRPSEPSNALFAACGLQPSCHDAFPNVEQDFYAAYDELTKSPVPVPITRPDGRSDTVSVDGDRLVADIRERIGQRWDQPRAPSAARAASG